MTETPVENPLRVFYYAAGSVAVFACMNMFVKLAAETQSIAQIMFFRNILALIPILFLMLRLKDWSVFRTSRFKGHMKRGIVGLCGMTCSFTSFSLLPMAQATAISFASPLILTALSVPLLNERVGIHRWCAVVVGLCSVLYMVQPFGHTGGGNLLGHAVALTGTVFSALAAINVRRLGATEHALTIVFYFTLTGAAVGFVSMFLFWHPLTPLSIFYLLMIGLSGGIGQVLLTYAYARAPAAYVSPFSYLAILFSALFDIVIWHHVPGHHTLIGSGLIIASGLYVIFREVVRYGRSKASLDLYDLEPAQPTEKDEIDPLEKL